MFDLYNDFNHDLVQKRITLNFESYFESFHDTFYNKDDIAFRKYLSSLEDPNDHFMANSNKLKDMQVENISDLIKEFNLKPDEDYVCRNDAIYFTSTSFKLLLLKSKNIKYIKYYVILEQCVCSYLKYTKLLEQNEGYFSWILKYFK